MFRLSGKPGVSEHTKVHLGVRAAGRDEEFELSVEGKIYYCFGGK